MRACDLAAASPSDPALPPGIAGIDFDKIDVAIALPACRAAVAANPNSPRLMFEMGRSFEAAKDNAQAVDWYRRSANFSYTHGEYALGLMYYKGIGVAQDHAAAVWFLTAAARGNVLAESVVGALYHDGDRVPKDLGQALNWSRKAAEQGNA